MFKKLKDKLAEEVKSSPQRIQQFAQAAQAAVTSASSSISDITNNDLFSIGDNDAQQQSRLAKSQPSVSSQQNSFQDVSLVQPLQSPPDSTEYNNASHDILDNQRQRRLSNSSFASDVSFRLPSYETPSMYHLQSDMEVSASEAEERGFSSGTVSLDRVTKDQLYAAYRRTQERYTKYRTQYGDLARHYKLLERENAKARSVLVETQDKALRRISELREQCSLEQSAKAHLEKALRIEIEEKSMKIDTLKTKVQLLQENSDICSVTDKNENIPKTSDGDGDVQLINLSNDNDVKQVNEEVAAAEMLAVNNKIEKMEQLLNKYKDSLKTSKEKNSQINTELQLLSNELENKNKEIDQLKLKADKLIEAHEKIKELGNINEELQNKINVYEFHKTREQSTLEIDYQKAQEEITELNSKIEVFSKREEEYAISLAENKLSIHKELESKETEIRSLKDNLDVSKKEIQSLNIVINDYKKNLASLETERTKLLHDTTELISTKSKIEGLETTIEDLTKKCHSLEQTKLKADEGYKCLQLQMKQETAEKLAMIDRNVYLENRNMQLSEDNTKKSSQIGNLESELQKREKAIKALEDEDSKKDELFAELTIWKEKYAKLESEIQEERDELIKLQSEIEKLLANHELLQTQNIEFRTVVSNLKLDNASLQEKMVKSNKLKSNCYKLATEIAEIKNLNKLMYNDAKSLQIINKQAVVSLVDQINFSLNSISLRDSNLNTNQQNELKIQNTKLHQELKSLSESYETLSTQVNLLQDENNNLKSTLNKFEVEKQKSDEHVKNVTQQYELTNKELNFLKKENENLQQNLDKLEDSIQNLLIEIEFEKKQYLTAVDNLNSLKIEKESFMDKVKSMENQSQIANAELDTFQDQHKMVVEELNTVKREYTSLLEKMKILDSRIASINTIQDENKTLTLENISLKSQVESTANSYKSLEAEINDVRKSHAEIVAEKDNLNEIIEKLEKNAFKTTVNKDSQTENKEDEIKIDDNTKDLTDIEGSKSEQVTEQFNLLSNKYVLLKTEYDLLKEENRRFKSDIEGLQTYLTKISKENSVLNDKLRELIATSDHSTDSAEVSTESGKKKIDDLLRENSLLIEENLELKDQLQTQNSPKPEEQSTVNDVKNETSLFRENYNNLLQQNSTLEKKMIDLEHMNKSVTGNMAQMQEKNEKLRLSNEKLERRLDEALVSLRHLHSLQENTELEYLRNILYEYLTGSGMHSVTLAKVLSAIVKFDDMQTKLVMQKEKERQGFLRQLGII